MSNYKTQETKIDVKNASWGKIAYEKIAFRTNLFDRDECVKNGNEYQTVLVLHGNLASSLNVEPVLKKLEN